MILEVFEGIFWSFEGFKNILVTLYVTFIILDVIIIIIIVEGRTSPLECIVRFG